MEIIKTPASGCLSPARCTFLAARATDEMTEMAQVTLVAGTGQLAALDTRSGPRDEQRGMFLALVGAIIFQLFLQKTHNRPWWRLRALTQRARLR
jgi:uncharacterized membrane protein YjdF